MDIFINILEPEYLGNLKGEEITNYVCVPMANDYEKNPILTYIGCKVKMNGKIKDCTEFHLLSGLDFISPVPVGEFVQLKKNIERLQQQHQLETKISGTWHSNYLQNGKGSMILN